MAVNLRKYNAMCNKDDNKPVANRSKKRTASKFSLIQSVFSSKRVVLSQPLINEFDYRSNCNTPCGT